MLVADLCLSFFTLYMYRTYKKRKMTFNKFWVLLVLVLLHFLFFQNCICAQLVNLSHDKKKKMLEKLNWFCLTGLITLVLLMLKCMDLLSRKIHALDWGSYIISIAKITSKKIGFFLWIFFLLRLLCISINLPYGLAWNTVVMSGQVLLAATYNC